MSNASQQSTSVSDGRKLVDAREAMSTLMDICKLLNVDLDAETLVLCVKLCEQGVNAEALAHVINELRKERDAIQQRKMLIQQQQQAELRK